MRQGVSISHLARKFGLSRSALLYYDRIGLLQAKGRTAAGYRTYSIQEERRLARICEWRRAGLGLADIRTMLTGNVGARSTVIARRLGELAQQIVSLRQQQRLLVSLHKRVSDAPLPPLLDKAAWVEMLRQAGMDAGAMRRWHVEFERRAPDEHEQFLASLGITPDEVGRIRRWSSGTCA